MEKSAVKEQAPSMRAFKKWFLRFLLGDLLIVSVIFGIGIAILEFFITARHTDWLGGLSVGVMLTLAALAQVIVMSGTAWLVANKLNISNRYVNRVTLAGQATYPDPRPALKSNSTPALILRGECDFIPLAVAKEYE